MSDYPDYIVLRHGPDVPERYWSISHEGLWIDRQSVRMGRPGIVGQAVAEPTNRIEVREDGAVAEVWEIRLTTPNEKRANL